MPSSLYLFSLLAASAGLGYSQFTFLWSATTNCGSTGLRCSNYAAYECCEEPPHPSSFPSARVTSSGPVGVVVWTELANDGGCGLCEYTGSLNTCYQNSPFNTAFVASITQCHTSRSLSERSTEKIAVTERHAECNGTVPLDTAFVDGDDYDIVGDHKEELIEDMLGLNASEFKTKWADFRLGPTPTFTF